MMKIRLKILKILDMGSVSNRKHESNFVNMVLISIIYGGSKTIGISERLKYKYKFTMVES